MTLVLLGTIATLAPEILAEPGKDTRLYPRPKPVAQMTLTERAKFQKRALAHYRGAHRAHVRASTERPLTDGERRARRWYRAAIGWTARELVETRRLLRPAIIVRALHWFYTSGAECVKSHEGGWRSIDRATGNTYFGAFQADRAFQRAYGYAFMLRWGFAHLWPPWAQIVMAFRGWLARGWAPWPNTSRICGLR